MKVPQYSPPGGGIPLILLPEWPLPLDLIIQPSGSSKSSSPILSLLSHPHPYNFQSHSQPQSSASSSLSPELEEETLKSVHHHQHPSWESFAEFIPLEPQDESRSSKQRILVSSTFKMAIRNRISFCEKQMDSKID